MCGIFCSIWNSDDNDVTDYETCKCQIERRGPDYLGERLENLTGNWKALFAASILWMQGREIFEQPCVDTDGNILLWNGDIFSGALARDDVSDTRTLRDVLRTDGNVPETLKNVKGPYSLLYYQANKRILYFARDTIGRHSLLLKASPDGDRITLSSTASANLGEFIEIPAIGVFGFAVESSSFLIHPWFRLDSRSKASINYLETRLGVKMVVFDPIFSEQRDGSVVGTEPQDGEYIDRIIRSIPETKDVQSFEVVGDLMKSLSEVPVMRERMERVLELLKRSIKLRIEKKTNFCQNCARWVRCGNVAACGHSKLGILFSGGVDSTILAALADEFVPKDESIDLVNVAFEKIRNAQSRNSNSLELNFEVPDRITGRQALAELQKICPWRTWNFVECNVTQKELQEYRSSRIRDLVYPLSTVLDDSLGCALWFASRASGVLLSTGERYESPCRVFLLGMGADELFGGYTRHRTTLRRGGWTAMSAELDAELARISERNLGRDDRIVSDHGRQSRFPYLDEDFVEYVSSLNAWERCNPTETMPPGLGDKILLRLVAYDIGLHRTANFPKRAFQFGSRIASNKQNAKDVSNWQ